jgi:putative ABC transport system permease protein
MGSWQATADVRILWRVLGTSLAGLTAYKLRSLFVICATALGIAALTVIVAAVDGAQRKAVEITEMFGPDAAFVLGGDIFTHAVGQRVMTLSWEDARTIERSLPGVSLVVPMRSRQNVKAKAGNENIDVGTVVGSTSNYAKAWDWPLSEGRDLSVEDVENSAKVALIGDDPSRLLFGQASPVGQVIFVQNIPFQIIGRLAYRGVSGGGGNIDDRIVIPLSTLTQRFNLDRKYFRALRVRFHDAADMPANAAHLRSLLRRLHRLGPNDPDDFSILTADEILQFMSMLKGSLVAFLGVTAAAAILVGGFVLANLFYLSVSERTHEIGLRRAYGATSLHILLQFLAEAVALTLVGALVGLVLGLALGQTLARLNILEIKLSWKIFTLALTSAVAIGVVFGLRPARRAARLDPIQALRGSDE